MMKASIQGLDENNNNNSEHEAEELEEEITTDRRKSGTGKQRRVQTRDGKQVIMMPAGWWQNTVLREWVPNVLDILARAGIRNPTIRRVFYTLMQNYVPKYEGDPNGFAKKNQNYKTLLHELSNVRFRRDIYKNWNGYNYRLDTFSDDSRPEVLVPSYRKPKQFAIEATLGVRYLSTRYKVPYWEGQKCVVEVMVEKQAMAESFAIICKPKQIVVVPIKGDVSAPYLYEQYKRWKQYQQEGKDVNILFYSDLDTEGDHMRKVMVDKILSAIELDVESGEEPLNWDWTKEDWDNIQELKKYMSLNNRWNTWYRKIVGNDEDNEDKIDRFTKKMLELHKASWHIKHYDPKKPGFSLKRVGLTLEQANRMELTKLDEVPISELRPGTNEYEFAKRNGGYSFTVELDAAIIENQEEFEEIVGDAIDKYHDDEIWQEVRERYGKEAKDKEFSKRVKFTKLANKEWEMWKNNELVLDDSKDEGEAPHAKTAQMNIDKRDGRGNFVTTDVKYTAKAKKKDKKASIHGSKKSTKNDKSKKNEQ